MLRVKSIQINRSCSVRLRPCDIASPTSTLFGKYMCINKSLAASVLCLSVKLFQFEDWPIAGPTISKNFEPGQWRKNCCENQRRATSSQSNSHWHRISTWTTLQTNMALFGFLKLLATSNCWVSSLCGCWMYWGALRSVHWSLRCTEWLQFRWFFDLYWSMVWCVCADMCDLPFSWQTF